MFLPLYFYVQRFAVIALALAHIAGHIHVGQKVHLDLGNAIALASFAAATFYVKAKAPGLIAA